MSLLDTALQRIEEMVDRKIAAVQPFRAIVSSTSSGMVKVRRLDATTAEDELRARVVGYDLAASDEVLCVMVSGKPVVVGQIQRAAPASADYAPPIAGGIFVVEDAVNSATTSSTTDTANYSTNVSVSVALPTGTWTVWAMTAGLHSHSSAGGNVAARTRIASDGGTYISAGMPSNGGGERSNIVTTHTLTAQTGTITVYQEYRAAVSGTAYAHGGSLFVVALRTA